MTSARPRMTISPARAGKDGASAVAATVIAPEATMPGMRTAYP